MGGIMSNNNIKTQLQRVPSEWTKLLQELIQIVEDNGYERKIYHPQVIRLLIHYKPSRMYLNLAFQEIIKGFQGVKKARQEVKQWMEGKNE